MIVLAHVNGVIAAPAGEVWSILADFAHPQHLAATIERCEMTGEGVGAVRRVTARGRTIHERLEALDPLTYRLCYVALETGDMPAPGLDAYRSTVVLTPMSDTATGIDWLGEGRTTAPLAPLTAHFTRLYHGAIKALASNTERAAPR